MHYTAAVITVSDLGSRGLRQDTSGPAVCAMLQEAGFTVVHTAIVPDEIERIKAVLCDCADEKRIDLIVTTGGTGLSPRDVTPEATLAVLEREIRAIPVAMWIEGLKVTPRAMLSSRILPCIQNRPHEECFSCRRFSFLCAYFRFAAKKSAAELATRLRTVSSE